MWPNVLKPATISTANIFIPNVTKQTFWMVTETCVCIGNDRSAETKEEITFSMDLSNVNIELEDKKKKNSTEEYFLSRTNNIFTAQVVMNIRSI